MPSAPLGPHAQYSKQCVFCHISAGDGAKLLSCAGCRVAHYCTKDCQKKDWVNHKQSCLLNQNGERVMKESTEARVTINGLSFKEVDHRFKKWQQVSQPVLSFYLMSALDLHMDENRCFTHMLWVTAIENMTAATPKATNSSDIVKYFRIKDAEVRLITELLPTLTDAGMRDAINSSVEKSRAIRRSGEAFGILIMIVYLESLNLQHLMTDTLDRWDPVNLPREKEWKTQLKLLIDRGAAL